MKKRLQGFGIGLFLAGATLTLLMQFTDFQQSKDNDEITRLQKQLLAAEQEIATLNEAVAQSSLQNETAPSDSTKPSEDEAAEEKESATKKEEPAKVETKKGSDSKKPAVKDEEKVITEDVISGTILIYEGVSLYDIGKQAEDQGIVQNGRELELFLYKPEYARSLQKGQFELKSDMSFEEMALILTGKQQKNR